MRGRCKIQVKDCNTLRQSLNEKKRKGIMMKQLVVPMLNNLIGACLIVLQIGIVQKNFSKLWHGLQAGEYIYDDEPTHEISIVISYL